MTFYIDPNDEWQTKMKSAGQAFCVEPAADGARILRAALPKLDACLFDGYEYDREIAAAADVCFTAQIADFVGKFAAGFVIAPGLGLEDTQFGTACVAGPRYALLRPEFAKAHDKAANRDIAAKVHHLLVTFGGRDSTNATGLVLDSISDLSSVPDVTVVIAADAPHRPEVERKAQDIGAKVLTNVDDMASLYLDADLSIGGGGVSLLERLCCGLPSLIVVQADNQLSNASAAQELGVAQVIGAKEALSPRTIATQVRAVCEDTASRTLMRARGLQMVDGRGAERAAAALRHSAAEYRVNSLPL